LSQPEEVVIGKHKFYIRRFPVRKAMRLSADLSRDFLAPAADAVAQRGIGGGSDVVQALAAVTSRTFQNMSGDKIEWLMNNLLDPECISVLTGETARRLTPPEFDLLNLDVAEVYELLAAVVRTNFLSLWERAKGLFGRANSLLGEQPASSETTFRMN